MPGKGRAMIEGVGGSGVGVLAWGGHILSSLALPDLILPYLIILWGGGARWYPIPLRLVSWDRFPRSCEQKDKQNVNITFYLLLKNLLPLRSPSDMGTSTITELSRDDIIAPPGESSREETLPVSLSS